MTQQNFKHIKLNNKTICKEYREGQSIISLAKKYNVYANKIRRILKKEGEPTRSKSEAQKIALAEGRSEHPTEGKERKESTKDKIGKKVSLYWDTMPDEKYEQIKEMHREKWENLSDEKKEEMRIAAVRALQDAARYGSKMENFLAEELKKNGYVVQQHVSKVLENQQLEFDIFLPELYTVIEVDGIAHFEPVWNEDTLQRTQAADAEKNGLLIKSKFRVIRIVDKKRNHSRTYMKKVIDRLLRLLENMPDQKLMYLEIK